MKKFYKIAALLLTLVFLTTYTPTKSILYFEKKNNFLKISKIYIENNNLISKVEI